MARFRTDVNATVLLHFRDVLPTRVSHVSVLRQRQDVVTAPVRDEHAGDAELLPTDDPARREGHDRRKEVAVRNAEREGVGRTVGEATDGDPAPVDLAALVRGGERKVDGLEVGISL